MSNGEEFYCETNLSISLGLRDIFFSQKQWLQNVVFFSWTPSLCQDLERIGGSHLCSCGPYSPLPSHPPTFTVFINSLLAHCSECNILTSLVNSQSLLQVSWHFKTGNDCLISASAALMKLHGNTDHVCVPVH